MDDKERLRLAKEALDSGSYDKETIEYIFPELKESEDERIVKELLTFFRESIHGGHILTNKEYDSWIAWLEKQGEKKLTKPKFKVGDIIKGKYIDDEYEITDIDDKFYKCYGTFIPIKEQDLWELVEQKTADKSDVLMSLDEAIAHCKEKSCGDNACALEHKQLEKWLTELKKLKEQKPAWSEEDKDVLEDIEEAIINYWHGDTQDILLARLKSLRPQNRWQPSAFHLECIEDAISLYETRSINAIGLKEILDELKKLKG